MGQENYISRVRLTNIRGFKELKLNVLEDGKGAHPNARVPRKRTLIIGDNGTGKTTLLRCIAIGLCDQAWGNALLAEDLGSSLVGQYGNEGTVEIELSQSGGKKKPVTVTTTIKRQNGNERVEKKTLPAELIPFVCGYGAGRAYEEAGSGPASYRIVDAVYTLFKYDTALSDPELILYRLKDFLGTRRHRSTMLGIKKALGLKARDRIYVEKGGGVQVAGPSIGATIPLDAWADGYRLTFTWILDLYANAMRARSVADDGGVRGIILVDELEQHLHTSLQTSILPRLSELLPEAQIFATTHSPVTTIGASSNEIVTLKRKGRAVDSVAEKSGIAGYSVEDVLVDTDYFDTPPYAALLNQKLKDYGRLAKIPKSKRTAKEERSLRRLANELRAEHIPLPDMDPLMLEIRSLRKTLSIKN